MIHAKPPRLVVRTTVATFIVVGCVLASVVVALTWNLRDHVRGSVAAKLEAGQRMLSALEQRRAQEVAAHVTTLADNPTLKAAIRTHRGELIAPKRTPRADFLATVEGELRKAFDRTQPDVLAVRSLYGELLAADGPRKADWMATAGSLAPPEFVTLPTGLFRLASAPITTGDVVVGRLELATALDEAYAQKLSELSGASVIIASPTKIVASTLPPSAHASVTPSRLAELPGPSTMRIGDETYALQLLFRAGDAAVFAVDSVDASAGPVMADAMRWAFTIALGASALALFASLWMAQQLSKPIDLLSRSVSAMTQSRAFDEPVPFSGSSREVDALAKSFNTMMHSVLAAEAETRTAYLGAIRALAAALDARDPYTAGHSDRVSAISVSIGKEMGLDDDQLEVLRLGALLHDIGKIGVPDHILRKPRALTKDEYEAIKQHPRLGAWILKDVPFLARHIPIVELHHERPDGKGYPYGLTGDAIPLLARITHVADAFDAMTSARAYRSAMGPAEAMAELWRTAGTQFDGEVVEAFARLTPQGERATGDVQRATCDVLTCDVLTC